MDVAPNFFQGNLGWLSDLDLTNTNALEHNRKKIMLNPSGPKEKKVASGSASVSRSPSSLAILSNLPNWSVRFTNHSPKFPLSPDDI